MTDSWVFYGFQRIMKDIGSMKAEKEFIVMELISSSVNVLFLEFSIIVPENS